MSAGKVKSAFNGIGAGMEKPDKAIAASWDVAFQSAAAQRGDKPRVPRENRQSAGMRGKNEPGTFRGIGAGLGPTTHEIATGWDDAFASVAAMRGGSK
jgi:hypothetical protein